MTLRLVMETPFGTETPHSTVVEAVETVMIDDEMRELEICVDRYRNSSEFTFYTLLFMNHLYVLTIDQLQNVAV